jgi:hypothetical protein
MKHHKHSPSTLPAKAICPCYESRDEAGDAAGRGTLQHSAADADLRGEDREPLPEEDEKMVSWYVNLLRTAYMGGDYTCHIERIMTLFDDDFNELSYGWADFIAVSENHVHILDYKSGRERNYTEQMDCYARMAMQNFDRSTATVHICYGRTEWVESRDVRWQDTDYIEELLVKLNAGGDNPQVPCDYCGWCKHHPCSSVCQEAEAVCHGYQPENPLVLSSWHASQITDPAEMAVAKQAAAVVKKWAESVDYHALQLAATGVEIPGYRISSKQTRSCNDIAAAYEASGLEALDFLACCSLNVGKLEKAIAARMGAKTVNKKVKEEIDATVGEYIESKTSKGYLRKVGK